MTVWQLTHPRSAAVRAWVLPVALGTIGSTEAAVTPAIADGSWVPAAFAALMALPLAVRKQQPLAALAGTLVVFAVQEVLGPGTLSEAVTPFVVLIVAMYSAASRLRGAQLLAALVGSAFAVCGTIAVDEGGFDAASTVYALVVITVTFVAGRLMGQRSREAGRLAEENVRILEERAARERAAVARERMRIANELHDLITHRVSAMVLQAATERRILERSAAADPAALGEVLESIETLGREAMLELRQLLGALSHEGAEPRTPQPRIADLQGLVARTSQAGVQVHLGVVGPQRELPMPVEVSVYRLAQEALTNAMRHASGSDVRVLLEFLPSAVVLTVENGPRTSEGRQVPGSGLGIPGMRERAELFGGSLDAHATDDGGFLVRAHLPVDDEPTGEGGA